MSFEFVEDHREYLVRELKMRLVRNPHYSQRAFARDLELSPSSLNDYMRNKLKFSTKRLSEISNKIGLTKEQSEHWNDLCEIRYTKSAVQKKLIKNRVQHRLNDERSNITVDQFKIISEWQYMAILELIQINQKYYSEVTNIAKDLDLPLVKVKEYIKLLKELNLIYVDNDQILKTSESTFVQNEVPSIAVRQYHYQILKKAQEALDNQPMNKRYNSSIMIGIPEDKISSAIQEINQMAMKILEPYIKLDAEAKNIKLYCLGLQFFSLMNSEEKP